MFGRGDVADQVGAEAGRLGRADGRGDVVEAGRHVGGDRSQHVVGRAAAHPFLQLDVPLDLVQGDVPRSLHQHLAPHIAPKFGQLAVDDEFLDLGPVAGVMDGPGPEAVSQGEHGVVFLQDGRHPVELLVKRVLALVGQHPGHHGDAPLGYQATVAVPLFSEALDGV